MKALRQVASDRLLPQARIAGPMPWVIAIMIALTVIAAGAGLGLRNLTQSARNEIAGGITVQIVEGRPAERERQVQAALSLLDELDGVAEVRRVPDEELKALLEPWLGPQAASAEDALPVPAIIDVKLAGSVTEKQLKDLRATIVSSAPSARVDAQARWLQPVFDAAASLQWLAVGLIVLLAGTSAAAVWLAARSALGSNHETIEIVHLLGGTDAQIARIFQRSVAFDAALGGLAGLALGLAAVLLLGKQFAALGSGMVAGGGLGPVDWAVLALIPVIGVALAILTARLTVLAVLRQIL
jgi:cell division transport system permease protein